MNIEESIEYLKLKIKNDNLTIQGMFGDIYEEIQKDNTAIETLLTAYEKEKEKNKRYFKQNIEYQKTLEKLQKETVWKDKVREVIQKLDRRIVEKSEINYFANLTIGEALSFKHFLEKEILEEE